MSSVSQINYWRESKKPDTPKTNTTEGGPGGAFLSYDMFIALSVLGGLFGLDHLYLRSPLTFIAKIIVNFLTFGSWWLYDASQAVFNKDVVKVFGLGVPGLGPKGIGAGMLASDVPDKKHMAFFIYGLALMMGGIFGLDSFIVGDKQSGFIRLICLITAIFAPIAMFWWLYKMVRFFFKTKDVTNQYWEYFGAPPPADHGLTWSEKLTNRFSFLQFIFGPIKRAKNEVVAAAEAIVEAPLEMATIALDKVTSEVKPVINAALAPVSTVVQPVANAIGDVANVAKEGIVLGEGVVDVAGKAINVAGETAQAATEALKIVPEAAENISKMQSGVTTAAVEAALKQQGGANNSVLPYALVGTLGLISVSGFMITYLRSKKNERKERNDSPPEPGVLRESDKEKSS
jgi:hypothetical protein